MEANDPKSTDDRQVMICMSDLKARSALDEDSDDVEDEVFVRDGKAIYTKMLPKFEKKLKSDERPLMPLKNRAPSTSSLQQPLLVSRHTKKKRNINFQGIIMSAFLTFVSFFSIGVLTLIYIFASHKFPNFLHALGYNMKQPDLKPLDAIQPCLNMSVVNIWTQTIPKLKSDSEIKMLDVNKDNVDDIIIGIGTELDGFENAETLCTHYFDKDHIPCSGGVIAINGRTGNVLWHRWLRRLVLSIHCDFEITNDGINDCIAAGKGGMLVAMSGSDGAVIWELEKPKEDFFIDMYSVMILPDVDGDDYYDLLVAHAMGNRNSEVVGHLLVMSGHNGNSIQRIRVPSSRDLDSEFIINPPQTRMDMDGNIMVFFTTGDSVHPGGLYAISLHDLLQGDESKVVKLYHFDTGIPNSPVIVDLNVDGIDDVIFMAADTVVALEGKQFKAMWEVSLHTFVKGNTHTISITSAITPAFFNNDKIPDVLISFAVGEDFPEYYYSMTVVLGGDNGELLIQKPIVRSSVADTVGGISVSFSGIGNDAFLFWTASCDGYNDNQDPFSFVPDDASDTVTDYRSDLCTLRFNSDLTLQLNALNQHMPPPGVSLYSSTSTRIESKTTGNNDFISLYKPDMDASERPVAYYKALNSHGRNWHVPEIDNTGGEKEEMFPDHRDIDWKVNWKPENIIYRANQHQEVYTANEAPTVQRNNDFEIDTEYNNNIQKIRDELRKNPMNPLYESESKVTVSKLLPRVTSSGVITNSYDGEGLDIVLVNFEVIAGYGVQLLTGKKEKCVQDQMTALRRSESKLNGLDENLARQIIVAQCSQYDLSSDRFDPEEKRMNRFFDIQMGNLIISRHRLMCECRNIDKKKHEVCSTMLPYANQSYPAYLAKVGNAVHTSPTTLRHNKN